MQHKQSRCLVAVVLVAMAALAGRAWAADAAPDVVYVPTPNDVVAKMLELAAVKKDDVVYDLGCGDGRIVVTAAKKFGCQGVGFEISPTMIKESNANVKKNRVEHLVTIKEEDIFRQDLSKASVVTLYLLPSLNVKLIPQLEKMKPGSRIVSHAYGMKGVVPDKIIAVTSREDASKHYIYLWTVPFKKTGPLKKTDPVKKTAPPEKKKSPSAITVPRAAR